MGEDPIVSFHDKVLGNKQALAIKERTKSVARKLDRIEHEDGNRLLPNVYLDESVFQELCSPSKDALVIKLL